MFDLLRIGATCSVHIYPHKISISHCNLNQDNILEKFKNPQDFYFPLQLDNF